MANIDEFDIIDPDSIGVDLELSGSGDFDLGLDDDLSLLSGYDELDASIIRLLLTPIGGIASLIQDVDGLSELNRNWGNRAWRWLSEPINNITLAGMREDIRECLGLEERIELINIAQRLVPQGHGGVNVVFLIEYLVTVTSEVRTIALTRSGDGFTAQ